MRPNFFIFVVDELRYPPSYETDELKEWKRKNLKFIERMKRSGVVFHNHYTNTNACSPARATFHTGQYPNVHGMTQTTGAAKQPLDPDVPWLPKFTVPTIGNYFQEAGYKTYLKGKWHVSDADIRYNSGESMLTFDMYGNRLPLKEEIYLKEDVLKDYGYSGWIGPEPHGTLPENSASSVPPPESGRDVSIADQVIELLRDLDEGKPWLTMASLVNPHDIATFGAFTEKSKNWAYPVDETLPKKLFSRDFMNSMRDDLSLKPAAQADYKKKYAKVFQPIGDLDRYIRLYYTLMKRVDEEMLRIWKELKSRGDFSNTYVLFFSDHGDLLASHDVLHQKWFTAYEEAIHIPLIINGPWVENRDVYKHSSHIDILPTLLGLAGLNGERLRERMSERFSLALDLPGIDLMGELPERPIYYNSQDNPTEGLHQVGITGPYEAVSEPCSVEAIIALVEGKRWKLTRYYDGDGGRYNGILNELYCLTDNPLELGNDYGKTEQSEIQEYLTNLLNEYSFENK